MNKYFSIAIISLILISGCVSAKRYRVVSENDIPNYLQKISDIQSGVYHSYWVQPYNKKEKCECLMEGYSFDEQSPQIEPEQMRWDGDCKDGKTHGLGKMTVNTGSFDWYEIAYHNLGITDRHYYRGVVGDKHVKFGSYVRIDGKSSKLLETTATIDSTDNIESIHSVLEIDSQNHLGKGIHYRGFSDGSGKYTGIVGNKLFFGTREFYDTNSQLKSVILGFSNKSTEKPDSYVILKNQQGLWHQYYEFGTVKENVQLPQSYIDSLLKITEEAANSARKADSAGQLALSMKKKYDSKEKRNREKFIPSEDKKPHEISTGTGFFISDNGYLLTNSHVVNGASKLSIILEGKKTRALLIDQDPSNDIAILKVERSVKGLALGIKNKIKQGTEIAVLGYPNIGLQGNEQKATFGYINANSGIKGDVRYFQISSPIQPGNSGSPLLDAKGIVIGIASASLNQRAAIEATGTLAQNVNYAVKIAYALPILINNSIPFKELNNNLVLNKTSMIERVSKSVVLIIAE